MATSQITQEEFTTQEVFESAVSIVRNLPKEGAIKPSDELKLKLYAYYKQAVHGPNDTPKPRFYQLVEVYKWDTWKKLGDMSREEAMLSYIGELKKIMESIPEKSADSISCPQFEDVLGKKFYDYCKSINDNDFNLKLITTLIGFKQWKQSDKWKGLSEKTSSSTQYDQIIATKSSSLSNNNTQVSSNSSSSSDNSSLSLLDESQSMGADEDGYKTPTSLATAAGFENLIVGQASDQYAAAILRLQKSLDQTNLRLDEIELKINQKSPISSINHRDSTVTTNVYRSSSGSLLINLLKNIKSIHWFYLTYPVLIYFVMRSMEGRRRSRTQNISR